MSASEDCKSHGTKSVPVNGKPVSCEIAGNWLHSFQLGMASEQLE